MKTRAEQNPSTMVEQDLSRSIVKIEQTSCVANVFEPWAPTSQPSTSTGFFIRRKQDNKLVIITNSHCVTNTIHTMVRYPNETRPTQAKVVAINYLFDLAMLEVADEAFLSRAEPLVLAENLPKEKNPEVSVHGFPAGRPYSVTKGTISRIDTTVYAVSGEVALNLTLDVTIQGGNSGGPLTYVDEAGNILVVGVAHQSESAGAVRGNSGFGGAIPLPCLKHFLDHPEGVPTLPFFLQPMKQPAMRKKYSSVDSENGILITKINPDSKASESLQVNDVVLEIDGYPVKVDGTIKHPDAPHPINYIHLINMHAIGDTLKLKILRTKNEKKIVEGQEVTEKVQEKIDVEVLLTQTLYQACAVKNRYDGKHTEYFTAHGLVFSPLSKAYTREVQKKYINDLDRVHPLVTKLTMQKTDERRQVIVISNVIRCEQTEGLQCFEQAIVDSVDGEKIRDLYHLMDLLNKEQNHTLVLENKAVIILEHLNPQQNSELLKSKGMPITQAPPALMERYTKKRKREEEIEQEDTKKIKLTKEGSTESAGGFALPFFNQKGSEPKSCDQIMEIETPNDFAFN